MKYEKINGTLYLNLLNITHIIHIFDVCVTYFVGNMSRWWTKQKLLMGNYKDFIEMRGILLDSGGIGGCSISCMMH